jgi:hypothetical protein
VIRRFLRLLRTAPEPRRLALLALAGAAAVVLGFVAVSPRMAEKLIATGGYYYMTALFVGFAFYAWRVAAPRAEVWRGWLRRPGWAGAGLAAATVFALWCDPFRHKVLFDEYVLQATALHMHATKEIGTVYRAYEIAGSWVPIDTFLDKRPYFFTYLVSLVHDFTGYRIANLFLVNAALTPAFFALVYWLGRALTGRRGPALLGVALLATMPLLGQQASGAGMELHNLAMLALAMAVAVLYLRAPDADRLALLVLATLLLAQSRYESVLFVAPAALVIVAGWLRGGRVLLPWIAVAAPLLLVPYAWHNRFLSASPLLWQLHEGQTTRFALGYLAGNLEGAWGFFFNFGLGLANSWYLSALGVAGLGWLAWRAWSRARARRADGVSNAPTPSQLVLLAFGAAIAANLALLMFYYWSRLDDVIASRFALPMCLLLALCAAVLVRALDDRRWPATRLAALGLGAWLLGWGFPVMAHRFYTDQNLVMQEVEWEHEQLVKRPGRILFVSNKSTLPFVLWRVPALITGVARQRGEQIAYHLREGTFSEVVIAQALRPTTAGGEMGVDPDDLMPANFHLEPFAVKRFGGRWARLSRLVSIDETPAAVPSQ